MAGNLQITSWHISLLLRLLLTQTSTSTTAPATCLTDVASTSITALIDCFNSYTVPSNTYNENTYNAAQPQPSTDERAAWSNATTSLLYVDGNCTSLSVPPAISGFYSIDLFTESTGAKHSYCVLSESTITTGACGYYTKGWGLVAVPATRAAITRDLHISAPHPIADKDTPQQAAEMFGSMGARSLVVAGRHRRAYDKTTICVKGKYYMTDPAHDNVRYLFVCLLAVGIGADDLRRLSRSLMQFGRCVLGRTPMVAAQLLHAHIYNSMARGPVLAKKTTSSYLQDSVCLEVMSFTPYLLILSGD